MRASAVLSGMMFSFFLWTHAEAQTTGEVQVTRHLQVLADQLPDCREFRNACQVCVRIVNGKLGCSNIGVACNPSGPWRCSTPSKSGEAKRP